jgi:hypothetical protein
MWDVLRFGLAVFAGEDSECAEPDRLLAMGDHTAAAIQASYAGVSPGGRTPMALALETTRTSGWVDDPTDPRDASRRKAVVLITDGQPNCDREEPEVSDQAALFAADGVPVYVVGFGDGVDPAVLDAVAVAGGTDNPSDPAHAYFQANDATELEDALGAITGSMVTCDLELAGVPPDASRLYVLVDGVPLLRGDPDGWEYDAASNRVTILGATCDALRSATSPEIRIYFGCPEACTPTAEECDYVDNDCDGVVDEGCAGCGAEVCDGADNDCDGVVDEGCGPGCVPADEVCDYVDNDCDGVVDEGCAGCDAEVCDGADNDCDGEVDEGCAPACVPTVEVCDGADNDCDGEIDEGCDGCEDGATPEICDGLDNDCDGLIDEGCPECAPSPEVCDGVDNDCDGEVDEGCSIGPS